MSINDFSPSRIIYSIVYSEEELRISRYLHDAVLSQFMSELASVAI